MAEQELKKLPLGILDFRKIIEGGYVYVDKTQLLYQLVTTEEYYFISRPRRFGKSLLISTLTELFSGNRTLFKNLWIDQSDYDWPQHPVICFDFSSIGHRTVVELRQGIYDALATLARQHNVDLSSQQTIEGKFKTLIELLAQKNKVVILIDEYDRPILDHIDNLEQAREQREVLKSLYSVIKSSDQYLRFVLLTGVSKFSKTSIFSGINNLRDISLSKQYATFLGYTKYELVNYFEAHLMRQVPDLGESIEIVIERMKNYYDGYRFAQNAEQVFNPYSVLSCLIEGVFENYWFETGTPTFLFKLLRQFSYDVDTLTHPVINKASLDTFEPNDITLAALLFQTGYLTITEYDPVTNNYTLGIPNREVNNGLTVQLADALTGLQADKSLQFARRIFEKFARGDMVKLERVLQEFFNKMPYTVHVKNESQLQFVLYAIFALIGVTVDPEVTTSLGRADLVVSLPKLVYVIELKFNGSAIQALEQIRDKKYYEKYENSGKQITLVGINFDEPVKTVSLESQMVPK